MRTDRPRDSMRAPIEEAATPLPREEHTPPVTKISFFMGLQYPGRDGDCQLRDGRPTCYPGGVDYVITREEQDGSPTTRCVGRPSPRRTSTRSPARCPAIGGIAEIYYRDRKGKLNLFCLQRSWYGGLRAVLRERCDAVPRKRPLAPLHPRQVARSHLLPLDQQRILRRHGRRHVLPHGVEPRRHGWRELRPLRSHLRQGDRRRQAGHDLRPAI